MQFVEEKETMMKDLSTCVWNFWSRTCSVRLEREKQIENGNGDC